MSAVWNRSNIARMLSALVLALAVPASAQLVPLEDLRQTFTKATYRGVTVTRQHYPSPFQSWEDTNNSTAEKYELCENPPPDSCLVGSCHATAYQNSQFLPGGIQFSGFTGAGWGIPEGDADWSFQSTAAFLFRVDTTFDCNFFVNVDPGEWPFGSGGGVYLAAAEIAGPRIEEITSGSASIQRRLGPGTYYIEGWTSGNGNLESFQGAAYFGQFVVQQVQQPIITTQPPDLTTGPGGTIICPIQTSGPQPTYVYQWRRNHTPLTDDGHFTGTTTATLGISNAVPADEGDYDVVVTGPDPATGVTVSEPSRLAHFHVLTTTGVGEEPANPVPFATVRAPAPNPFRLSTSVGYEVGPVSRLVATVYSVSGTRIRVLADRTVSGVGSVNWDGRLSSGARAPAGVYFVHVDVASVHETRKIVLLQ
ncbi:MAG TPA: hypothetical protein VFU59_08615 [Candidatus Eisenbacteria bacterium]|nr:hypothetical protein [Candidatus Eisenbacteria bacterium]